MTSEQQTEVAIVGAGPSGLLAAVRLAQHGIQARIVDRSLEQAKESRAALVHAATIEIFDRIGIAQAMIERGCRLDAVSVVAGGRVLARAGFDGLDSPFPFGLGLPQDKTEALLIERLAELGVTVERGVTIDHVHADDDGCLASGTDAAGAPWRSRSRYLIGADGKNGVVRDAMGIPFDARPYRDDFVLADVALDPAPAPDNEARIVLDPEGLVVFGLLPSGRHRIVATARRGVDVPAQPDLTYVNALLRARHVPTQASTEPVWSSRFHIVHGVAQRFRAGRVLLCGDAAHVHSPAAGQGMNTGIADAYDLADRIAAELGGTDGALDGYEPGRMAAAREVVRFTDRMTRAALLRPAPAQALRNAALATAMGVPAVRRRLVGWISGIDRSPLRAAGVSLGGAQVADPGSRRPGP